MIEHTFAAPTSVVCTVQLDDDGVLREIGGLTLVEVDTRGRYVLRGPTRAYVNVIDTCFTMGLDHADEDPYARNALKWARREAEKAIAAGWAKRSPYGGLDVIE